MVTGLPACELDNCLKGLRSQSWGVTMELLHRRLPKSGLIRRTGRLVLRTLRPHRAGDGKLPGIDNLNQWQEGFCVWHAERLGISYHMAVERYRRSWNAFPGGHAGLEFRRYCVFQMNVLSVLADDSPKEVYESYQLHSGVFLLRQLSQAVPEWPDGHPILAALSRENAPTIIDFGCGLAQASISLALALKRREVQARLFLADLPSVRLEFVAWLCRHLALACETASCTRDAPVPDFPAAHVAVATEVFEHLHDPLPVFERIHAALVPGGFLITNVDDHEEEFMHVTPNLGALRNRLASLGYTELERHVLYRKP